MFLIWRWWEQLLVQLAGAEAELFFNAPSFTSCCSFALPVWAELIPAQIPRDYDSCQNRKYFLGLMLRGGRTHTISLSLSSSLSRSLSLYCDYKHTHNQATCLSIISCLFMESFSGGKKGWMRKWIWLTWFDARYTPVDRPVGWSGFCTVQHVKITICKQVAAPRTGWIELQIKCDNFFFLTMIVTCRRACGYKALYWHGPCDFSLGVKDVTLAIPCQCY